MIVNISNPKTSKTYSAKVDEIPFVGKKLGDEVNLDVLGFKGKGIITGGSTKEGFPMVPFLENPANKNVLLSDGIGFKAKHNGEKRRKTIHGRTIGDKIAQINVKILEFDASVNLDELFPKKEDEKKK